MSEDDDGNTWTRVTLDAPGQSDKSMVMKCNKELLDSMIEEFWSKEGAPLIQDAFPHINVEEREFLLTGMTPEEWDELMGPEE